MMGYRCSPQVKLLLHWFLCKGVFKRAVKGNKDLALCVCLQVASLDHEKALKHQTNDIISILGLGSPMSLEDTSITRQPRGRGMTGK